MAEDRRTEAVAVTFNNDTVGPGMNVESIARAINDAMAGRTYLGHVAIRRNEIGHDLKGPNGLILFVESQTDIPAVSSDASA